jgi:methionyl-tRNA formyltransferase
MVALTYFETHKLYRILRSMPQDVRIAYIGAEPLSVPVLEELEKAGMVPAVIVTGPDVPVGRKKVITPPATKLWAEERGIEVLQPESLRTKDGLELLVNSEWDVFLLASYGKILPKWFLDIPHKGTLNVHPSLLPKQRGPSPVRSAILEDKQEDVGVTIMLMDEEMDHGPIVAQATVELPVWPVGARGLEELLAREGGRLLAEVVPLWVKGDITAEEQEHSDATVCKKFTKADGEIRPEDDGYENYLKYCAFDGWPGVFFFDKDGKRVKITEADYVDGELQVLKVIPEGKNEVPFDVWRNSQS